MNLELLFKIATCVWLAGEILIIVLTQTWRGGKTRDRGTQILLWVVIVAALNIEGWMHNYLPPDMPGSDTWLRPLAFGILIFGMAIRTAAIINLGKAFSTNVALRSGQKLQRSGLYSLVRHPSYLGLELIFLAIALHARTWACFAVAIVPTTLALLVRIHVEETALRQAFGPDYDDYCRSTKRLIPGIY